MDRTYLDGWKNSLTKGFDVSKSFVYGSMPSSTESTQGWTDYFQSKIGPTKSFVSESSYLDASIWKSYFGYGYDKTKGLITGYMVVDKDDLEALKSSAEKGLDATKGFLYGTLILNENSNKIFETGKGFLKGAKLFNYLQGNNIIMKITQAGQVNILHKATKDWIVRLDRAHKGYNYNHLNIRTKFSGLKTDPHLYLPPGSLQAGRGTAKLAKAVNTISEVAIPIIIAIDLYKVGNAAIEDTKNGTSRKTVETSAQIGSGWVGAYTGGMIGGQIGTALLPGVGTMFFGLVGAIGGGMALPYYASSVVGAIGDKYKYNITDEKCDSCDKPITVRKYKGEDETNAQDSMHENCKIKDFLSDENYEAKLKSKL